MKMNYLDLFSGIGGFALGIQQAGIKIEKHYFSEVDKFAIALYKKRFPAAIALGDIKTIKGVELGRLDLITGGFPCQPFSNAGKRRSTEDDRHLWPEMFRVIKECKPRWVVGENVAGIINLALHQVLSDLEAEGYEVYPFVVPACAVNAPHRRDRVWIVAYRNHPRGRALRNGLDGNGAEKNEGRQKLPFGRVDGQDSDAPDTNLCGHLHGQSQEQSAEGYDKTFGKSISSIKPSGVSADTEGGQSGEQTEQKRRQDISGGDRKTMSYPKDERLQRSKQTNCGERSQSNDKPLYGRNREWDWNWLEVATYLCGVDDGLSVGLDGLKLSKAGHRVERLKSLGNAVVVPLVAEIFRMIKEVDWAGVFFRRS